MTDEQTVGADELRRNNEALRDMLDDARIELAMLREALGVPYEPHQTWCERALERAQMLRSIAGSFVTSRGHLSISLRERAVKHGEQTVYLTPSEWTIFEFLFQYADAGVEKKRLRELLDDGGATPIRQNAVEVYVSRMRRKLAALDVQIVTLRGFGYRLNVA